MSFTLLDQDTFTSTGVGVKVSLPGSCDYFVAKNLTQLATTQSTGRGVMFEWYPQLSDNEAIEWKKTNSTDALNMTKVTSGGFIYRTAVPAPEAEKSTSGAIARGASNTTVTSNSHGYSDGDRVRLYGTTGMLQIAGMDFTISSAATNTFIIAGIDTSGFAADATACKCRRLPPLEEVEPSALYVTGVSKATSAVVTLSVDHHFVVGQLIRFNVPSEFGMTELNGLTGKITAVGTYTITVDIDSTGFTTFAFPTSASIPVSFPMAAPAGQRNTYDVTDVPFQTGQFYPYMYLAAGAQSPAGSTSDVIVWQAWKAE